MKYNIVDIKKEFEDKNWKLLSEEYKNLETEMEMLCPEGHRVFSTYKKWRTTHECPICKSNPLKNTQVKVVPKKDNVKRTLAFDQATATSGYAVFDEKELVTCGKFHSNFSTSIEKIEDQRQWVASLIAIWQPDVVVFEDIQLQQFGPKSADNTEGVTTYKVLAHLQGVLFNYCHTNNIKYEVVHTATWRSFCDIKGKTRSDKKRSAQLRVKEWYDISVTQDEADAVCIGKYAAERVISNTTMISW